MSGRGPKKWFMLQMWRVQQVAQVLTIALLAVNLSLQVYTFMDWREGSIFATPYTGATMILLILAALIWTFAIIWDMRLRMWREQATVLMERNPYVKEKMTAKEILIYGALWVPLMENLGKSDPKMKEAAETMREWLSRSMKSDEILARDVKDIMDHIGKPGSTLLDFRKK